MGCAWALVDLGIKPTIYDAGEVLNDEKKTHIEYLRRTFGNWSQHDLNKIGDMEFEKNGFPTKTVFGSSFLFGDNREHSPLLNQTSISPCYAKGGFTVGWGGAVLPIHQQDMMEWPFPIQALHEGFHETTKRLGICGIEDQLSAEFPLFNACPYHLKENQQTKELLKRLESLQNHMRTCVGRARLALDVRNCKFCGLCLEGCPFGAIHTLDFDINKLVKCNKINYRNDVIVTKINETSKSIEVTINKKNEKISVKEKFDHVFLGAGAINTARIILESQERFEETINLLDSQKFASLIFTPKSDTTPIENRNTLPVVFFEMQDEISKHWTHLQISPFSRYAQKKLEQKLRRIGLQKLAYSKLFAERINVVWGGMHSEKSGKFNLALLRAHKNKRPILEISQVQKTDKNKPIKEQLRKVSNAFESRGIFLMKQAAMIAPPGAGNHFGGSFPMRKMPNLWNETDTNGKLKDYKRLSIVDSSLFPSIPATTMVLTIMANSWRLTQKTF